MTGHKKAFCQKAQLLGGSAFTAFVLSTAPAHSQERFPNEIGVSEIIVTAQKREQSLQDVPIAVTAITSDSLEVNRVTNVLDLSALAPGFTATTSIGGSGAPLLSMRGMLNSAPVAGADKQISIYIDGVYLEATRGGVFELPDVQRIEVLRGPQGTLFGRNSTGGAVAIYTREPDGEAGVNATASVGNRDHYRFRMTANTPQIGPFSGYISFVHNEERGSIRNLAAGQIYDFTNGVDYKGFSRFVRSSEWLGSKNSDAIFAAVKFQPSDRFKAIYKFDHAKISNTAVGIGLLGYDPNHASAAFYKALIESQAVQAPGASNGRRPTAVYNGFNTPTDETLRGHNLTAEFELNDQITLKNIAAYRSSERFSTSNIDGMGGRILTAQAQAARPTLPGTAIGSPFILFGHDPLSYSKQWSNELQVNYNSDIVTLTLGGLYFKSKQDLNPHGYPNSISSSLIVGGYISPNLGHTHNKSESIAGYAQAEIHITPKLDVVLGGRVTRDNKTARLYYGSITSPSVVGGSYGDTQFTYLAGVNYKPSKDVLIYGKWSTGYVSGGAVGPVEFAVETAKSAEAGFKGDLLDRRLRVNLSAYWVEYQNYQSGIGVTTLGPIADELTGDPALSRVLGTLIVSRGDIEAKGFELEVTAAPVQGVTFGGNFSYLDAKTSNVPGFSKVSVGLPREAPDSAYALTYMPKWTGSMYAQYSSQPLFGDTYLTARVDGVWTGSKALYANLDAYPNLPDFQHAIRSQAYWLVNGRISLREVDLGGINADLSVWGKNILDEDTVAYPLISLGTASATYVDARSYGLDLTISF